MKKLLIFLLMVQPALASTYYVRKDGSDSNTGLNDNGTPPNGAWLTIQQALNNVAPGDTVNVRAGTYYERLNTVTDGSPSQRITFNSTNAIVDGSTAVSGTWVGTTDGGLSGTGTWEISTISGPGLLMEGSNIQIIHQIAPKYMYSNPQSTIDNSWNDGTDITGFTVLSRGASYNHPFLGIPYWNGIEAYWGYHSNFGKSYLRYRNGDDPNGKSLRWSPGPVGTGSSLNVPTTGALHQDKDYYTWNNFTFQGAWVGVFIDGSTEEVTGNVIDGGTIKACHFRTYFYGRANINEVRNMTLRSRLIGFVAYPVAGTRIAASHNTDDLVAYLQYSADKFIWGESTERDAGMVVRDHNDSPYYKPTGNTLAYCEITEGAQGALWGGTGGGTATNFNNNNVHHNSSQGVYLSPEPSGVGSATNWKIFDNIFRVNGYTAIRTNALSNTMGTCYFYNNRISDLDDKGTHLGLYKSSGGGGNPAANFASTIWFVHNSFSGGLNTFEFAGVNSGTGAPNYRFVNNIISMQDTNVSIFAGDYASEFETTEARIGAWEANITRGSFQFVGTPTWFDGNNQTMTSPIWSTAAAEAVFLLPGGHAAEEAGIDVSESFTIRGTQYSAIPGFSSGYFSGTQPNLGRVFPASPSFFRFGYYGTGFTE